MVAALIRTVWRSMRSTVAPISAIASRSTLISLTSGRFSIRTVSSVIVAAVRIASAAFFAPPISTSPTRGFPPLMTYCSIYSPQIFFLILKSVFYPISNESKSFSCFLHTPDTLKRTAPRSYFSVSPYLNSNLILCKSILIHSVLFPSFSIVSGQEYSEKRYM